MAEVRSKLQDLLAAARGDGAPSGSGRDLRGFLAHFAARHPEAVYRVERPVDPRFEASGLLYQVERRGPPPVVVFEQVRGSSIPVVANVHGTFQRLAMALGLPPDATIADFTREYGRRESAPLPPVLVDDPPVQEVVLTGDAVDLNALPLLTYHEQDGGAYISLGFTVMRDPDSGVRNAGIYRLMRQGRDALGVLLSETGHGHYIWRAHERRGLPTPVAIFIGHHPAVHLGCQSFTPIDVDEFAVAGAMLGEPLRLARCLTVPLEVPADAEIVLEGEIAPDVRAPEAPFGEYPGTYGPQRMSPVIRISAITTRRDPLYQESFVAHPDHLLLGGVTRLSYVLKTVRIACPTVRQVYVPPCGCCRFICYIAMEKLIEGDPKNAAMAAFAADPFLKFVVVVDEDVDILNDSDVMHAIATRVRADTDTFMVTHARGSPLDPSSYDPAGGSHIVTKVGIDATRKANYPDEISVPGTDEINPDDYLVPCRD